MLKEFRAFILRGNVVDLAVGIVIGAAFKSIVDAFVAGFIDPLVSFFGTGDLASKSICVGRVVKGVCPHEFRYGALLSAMISFVLIAAVVFFLVVKPINHLTEMFKTDKPAEQQTRECPECLSSIPVRARRCSFCTATVVPAV
jgi:large conductance mechanosensitive channel